MYKYLLLCQVQYNSNIVMIVKNVIKLCLSFSVETNEQIKIFSNYNYIIGNGKKIGPTDLNPGTLPILADILPTELPSKLSSSAC